MQFVEHCFKYFPHFDDPFKVPPMIVPFDFGEDELNLDESVSTLCSINKGDLPLKIWWTFHEDGDLVGFNLTTNDGILITRSTQKVSMLAIDAVRARHRGNYTCFASNKGGVVQHSAYLAMNGLKSLSIRNQFSVLQFVSHF